jgi:hypothetical protein
MLGGETFYGCATLVEVSIEGKDVTILERDFCRCRAH